MDGRIRIFSDTMTSQNWRKCYLANLNTAADRRQRASVLLELISSLLACMQQNVALLNAEISYARRRLDICKLFTLSTGQNGRQKKLKRGGKQCRPRRYWVRPGRTSAWWNNLSILSESGVNPDTCGRANSIWIRCDHITYGRGYFRIRKEKVADSKISGYVWTGPYSREIVIESGSAFGRDQVSPRGFFLAEGRHIFLCFSLRVFVFQ